MNSPASSIPIAGALWQEWGAFVAGHPCGGLMQTPAWARFKMAEGYRVDGRAIRDSGRIMAGTLFYAYATPGGGSLLLSPDGPLLPWDRPEAARWALRRLADDAQALAAETGAVAWRIEPRLPPPGPSALRSFTRAPADLNPVQTLVLDLRQPPESLLQAMRPQGRRHLKQAERMGVQVRCSRDVADLRAFHVIFEETACRQEFSAEPLGFFLNLGAALFPADDARLYQARLAGRDAGGILIARCGGRVTYLYGAATDTGRRCNAATTLHWTAIRDAQRQGAQCYDFYGYEPFGLEDHPYAGFSSYKRLWGGQVEETIGAHDLFFYERLADVLVRAMKGAA